MPPKAVYQRRRRAAIKARIEKAKQPELTLSEIADDIQGNRWTKDGHDRLYMSVKDIGYGEKWDDIDNIDMKLVNRELQGSISKNDIGYIDLKTGEFVVPETSNRPLIVERMKYRIQQARQANEGVRYAIEKEYRQVTLPDGREKTQSRAISEGFKKIYDAPYGTEFSVKPAPDRVTGKVEPARRYVVTFGSGGKGSKGLNAITAEGLLMPMARRIPIDSEADVRKVFAQDTRITIHTKKIYKDSQMSEVFKRANREK